MREELQVYLLAGVATSIGFFHNCMARVREQCEQMGWRPELEVLFPYGDNSRSVFHQVREVSGDLPRRFGAFRKGGRIVAQHLYAASSDKPVLLLGHSGGGAAAYQAICLLEDKGLKLGDYRIAQIGSPRVPIRPQHRQRVYYAHNVGPDGRRKDPITRIGTWGGWVRQDNARLPRWDEHKYAPGRIEGIQLVGGHADYLRQGAPFVDEAEQSNMDKTLQHIWHWLADSRFMHREASPDCIQPV